MRPGITNSSAAVDDAVRRARETRAEMDDAVVGEGDVDIAAVGMAASAASSQATTQAALLDHGGRHRRPALPIGVRAGSCYSGSGSADKATGTWPRPARAI